MCFYGLVYTNHGGIFVVIAIVEVLPCLARLQLRCYIGISLAKGRNFGMDRSYTLLYKGLAARIRWQANWLAPLLSRR